MLIVILSMIPVLIFIYGSNLSKNILVITGPTGVGKTNFVNQLATELQIEIINADMGQMYTQLSIGTAKPAWKTEPTLHHLFDIMSEPVDFSAIKFRNEVKRLIVEIWQRNKVPVIVGGSTLYIKSLFYSNEQNELKENKNQNYQLDFQGDLWQKLNQIDPIRAQQLHPNDHYRLQRALFIWHNSGKLPSDCKPKFDPIADNINLIFINDDKNVLNDKIDQRVIQMMDEGWLLEVEKLGIEWHEFLRRKKIIGYEVLLDFLDQIIDSEQECVKIIQQRVRQYAKKQQTFWRSLKKDLELNGQEVLQINLTLLHVDLYIKKLLIQLKSK